MHGKINFSSAFMSSFQVVTCNRLSTYCYILQHYMPCKQWHNYRNLSGLSIGYFRSGKRSNIYDKTVFFAYIYIYNFCKIYRKPPVPDSLFQWSCRFEACNFIQKEILAQVFSCEFCHIFKNTFFTENLRTTASPFYLFIEAAFET